MNQNQNNGQLWSMNVYSPEGSNRMGVNRPVTKPADQETRKGTAAPPKPTETKR